MVGDRVDADALDLLPAVRVVANYGVGYDSIDVDECRRRGVAVTNTPGVLDAAVADLTLALILAVRRRVVEADRYVRSGRWERGWAETSMLGDDLDGAVLGIVGLGRIGQAVARRARAFGMRIAYAQRAGWPAEADELGAEYLPLDDLLARADVVTLHVPLTAETRDLIDARRLALLRDGAALVNTARGDVVEQDALVRELVSGRIRAGARRLHGRAGRARRAVRPSERRPDAAHRQRDRRDAGGDDAARRRQPTGRSCRPAASDPGLMRESPALAEIRRLDPVRDHLRIVYLDACFEFPFDVTRCARAGVLPHVRGSEHRRAIRLDRRVHRPAAQALRRHATC